MKVLAVAESEGMQVLGNNTFLCFNKSNDNTIIDDFVFKIFNHRMNVGNAIKF